MTTEVRFTHGSISQGCAGDRTVGQFCTGPTIVVCYDYVTIKKEISGDGSGTKL